MPSELEKEMTPLCHLARKYGTDKGGAHLIAGDTCHRYTPVYFDLFSPPLNERVKHVFEIGINHGCSLRMWRDFFPNAIIDGIDTNAECLRDYGERIRTCAADQFNGYSLDRALTMFGDPLYDLIVDDGSHESEHQVFSARYLKPTVAPGGFYVIEDMRYDCTPGILARELDDLYYWSSRNCGVGLGKAHCDPGCPTCHGAEGERLLVLTPR